MRCRGGLRFEFDLVFPLLHFHGWFSSQICCLWIVVALVWTSEISDKPKMNGEQKLTQPINLLSSALLLGMACSLNTFFLFSSMLMVFPFLIVIPNQSISLVMRHDFSALTKIPAFWNVLKSVSSRVTNSFSVSAANARSFMCVATYGFSSLGIIFWSIIDETCSNDYIPSGDTHHVYGVANEA